MRGSRAPNAPRRSCGRGCATARPARCGGAGATARPRSKAQLDDHAHVARACLELFAATHAPLWLERALAVTDVMLARLWDDERGGFFENPTDAGGIRVRLKDGFDGAETAGNSIAAHVLERLARLTGRDDLGEKARLTLRYHAARLVDHPSAMPQMVASMIEHLSPVRHVVIAGEDSPERESLIAVYESKFRPFDDLVVVDDASREALARLAPFTAACVAREGRPTAYVCVNHACRLPVHTPDALAAELEA
ncbi:MAG: glycoside hydrolase family 76 protein [Candidatus Eisenbacteria bacterium]